MFITKRQAEVIRNKVSKIQHSLADQKAEMDMLERVLANGGTFGLKVDSEAERDTEALAIIRRLAQLENQLSISILE